MDIPIHVGRVTVIVAVQVDPRFVATGSSVSLSSSATMASPMLAVVVIPIAAESALVLCVVTVKSVRSERPVTTVIPMRAAPVMSRVPMSVLVQCVATGLSVQN